MSIMYLANRCRPDISYAIGVLSMKCTKPQLGDRKCLDRLLRYLFQFPHRGIEYSIAEFNGKLGDYADCSFNHHADARSHGGIAIQIAGGLLSWKSYVIRVIVKDSNEGEIVTCDQSVDIAQCVHDICVDCGMSLDPSITVYQDNSAAIVIMTRGRFQRMRGSINVRFQFLKDLIERKVIKFVKVTSEDMIADGLTKNLHSLHFQRSTDQITSVVK